MDPYIKTECPGCGTLEWRIPEESLAAVPEELRAPIAEVVKTTLHRLTTAVTAGLMHPSLAQPMLLKLTEISSDLERLVAEEMQDIALLVAVASIGR
jgi:hypothetical protein